jgi:prevent-host-death family protein
MASYSITEAQNNFSKLMRRARSGEVVIITRSGKPLVQLDPYDDPPLDGVPDEMRKAISTT